MPARRFGEQVAAVFLAFQHSDRDQLNRVRAGINADRSVILASLRRHKILGGVIRDPVALIDAGVLANERAAPVPSSDLYPAPNPVRGLVCYHRWPCPYQGRCLDGSHPPRRPVLYADSV